MSETLASIRPLVARREIKVSLHGSRELAAEGLLLDDLATGIDEAVVIEDYPTYHKGPAVLVLQRDGTGQPLHVLWGLAAGQSSPAVLITAYRPDPERWSTDFLRRKT
jgi:hypothetical protein